MSVGGASRLSSRIASWLTALVVIGGLMMGLAATGAEARVAFSAISVDARTGKLIFALDADGLRHPASLTKMMTLYMLFSELKAGRLKLSSPITVSARAASMSPSKLGVRPGTRITVDQAIRAIVVISANDVASAIAENLGGSEAAFSQRMTRTAHAIGMTRSNFVNASGLPNPNQWTTARDMATLGLRLQRDFPQYYPYFRTMSFAYGRRVVPTHNRLLGHFAGTDGIKTGYTATSGFNLTTSTARDGKRVVGVVLGAPSGGMRNAYMMRMLDASFPKCQPGQAIVAQAGSSTGAVVPGQQVADAAPAGQATVKPQAKPSSLAALVAAKTQNKEQPQQAPSVDDPALAAAAAAEGDTGGEDMADSSSGSTIQTVMAGTAPASAKTQPETTKVLQANLGGGLPAKLPFQVKPEANQAEVDSQVVGALASETAWHIQVGPYASKADAVKEVQTLQTRGPTVLHGKQAFAITVQTGSQLSYHGRFSGLSEHDARSACAQISRLKQVCQVVAPSS